MGTKLNKVSDLFGGRLPLQADRYDGKFFLALGGVLAFTLVSYWSLTRHPDVQWFAGEDGVSEWWSVATYSVSAVLGAATAWSLMHLGYPRLGAVHLLFAAVLLVAALEEVSWGQRLFGWSTPDALSRVNEQDETTIHNIRVLSGVLYSGLFYASILALIGSAARAVLHNHRRVTTADFILPSLVLSPALLMIVIWVASSQPIPGNIVRITIAHFDISHIGSEVPEVLVGLCLLLYTYANFSRTTALRRYRFAGPPDILPSKGGRTQLPAPRKRTDA